MERFIEYVDGYKYQLAAPYVCLTDIRPPEAISNRFARLDPDGILHVRQDTAWDGPSGPTRDTSDSMRGSLVHDVLYSFMRMGLLGPEYREAADKEFRKILLEDGMPHPRAQAWYTAVRLGAGPAAEPSDNVLTIRAPQATLQAEFQAALE